MNENFFEALESLEKENNIQGEVLLEKIKQGLLKAVKKEYPGCDNISIDIDREKGKFAMSIKKLVVEGEPESANEINIDDAKKINKKAKVGSNVTIKLSPAIFGRGAAGAAKQSIRNDIKEFERAQIIEKYEDKVRECISATVTKIEPGTGIVTLQVDKNEIYLFKNEQIPGEDFREGDVIKVYVVEILNPEKKPTIKVSRKHRDLVKRLFELEIPEIYDGTVEVKAISREAGSRTKIAVYSNDANVDAIGACIGPKRTRISRIVEELGGEKIDIIPYSENDEEFIASALAPAEVIKVTTGVSEGEDGQVKTCTVVVPNNQLSLAIGNKGQNAKLAAKLTGYKIDIKPEHETI